MMKNYTPLHSRRDQRISSYKMLPVARPPRADGMRRDHRLRSSISSMQLQHFVWTLNLDYGEKGPCRATVLHTNEPPHIFLFPVRYLRNRLRDL